MEYDGTGERDFTSGTIRDELNMAFADNSALRQRVAELERAAVALNVDKMAFMREWVLGQIGACSPTDSVQHANTAWNAMVAACDVKP